MKQQREYYIRLGTGKFRFAIHLSRYDISFLNENSLYFTLPVSHQF